MNKLTTAISLVFISTLLCFGQSGSVSIQPTSRFVGTWTMNEALSKREAGLPLRFRSTPDGGLEEIRGLVAAPLAEPVHFDGKPYDIDSGNATIVWKQTGPNQFERQSFSKGNLESTRRIRISDDGKTLTEESERHRDGTTNLVTVIYSRTSGEGAGLAGIWNAQSRSASAPGQFTVSVAGGNQFRLIRRNGVTYTAALDNKPVPVTGPGVISGTTVAMRQIDEHSLEETDGRDGVITSHSTIALSADGKVLTVTSTQVGPNAGGQPTVSVYDKQ